jgi:peptidyl-prolyl cis-trans isomerase SurA
VEIREVVYKPKVNPAERAKALARAEEVRLKLTRGEDFASLAKRYSDDPGSATQGGDLGLVKRGSFVPEFEAMAYNLEPGQPQPGY